MDGGRNIGAWVEAGGLFPENCWGRVGGREVMEGWGDGGLEAG